MARAQIPSSTSGAAAGTVRARPKVRVYVKKTWEDAWLPANYVKSVQATLAAAPLKSSATFEWFAGRVKYADSAAFASIPLRNLRDFYVRVELLGQSSPGAGSSDLWIGRFAGDDTDFQGVSTGDNGDVARGHQFMRAYGLEHELDRVIVRGSWVTNDDLSAVFIDTPLDFNERYDGPSGLNQVGNRSGGPVPHPDGGGQSTYVFAGVKGSTVSPVQPWTVADICRYLFAFYCPPAMGLSLSGNVEALEQLVLPRVDLSGRSVFQALNHLIDRRRGLGWCLRHDLMGRVAVHVYSAFDEDVAFEDATIAANPEKTDLRLDDLHHLVDENTLSFDTLVRYGKIVVSGKPLLVCFTAKASETLFPGWTAEEQTAYVTCDGGSSSTPGTADLNDQARGDVRFEHVYSHFHLGAAPASGGDSSVVVNAGGPFRWRTSGDLNTPGSGNCNPKIDEAGRLTVAEDSGQSPIRDWGHRVERIIPFRTTKAVADADPEFERPFVILKSGATGGRWVMGHSTGTGHDARLTPLDNHFGIAVEFTPRHRLALGKWTATGGAAATPTQTDPNAGDGKDFFGYAQMQATIAVRTDTRLQVTVAIDPEGPLKDRVLHIEVPDAEFHYAVPGTVKGIKAALAEGDVNPLELVTVAESVLRDDGDRLRRIAAMAKAWYGKERGALSLTVNDLWQKHPVGSLIVAASDRVRSRPVNTPVTQVTYDLVAMRTSIRTTWAELDVTVGRSAGRKRT